MKVLRSGNSFWHHEITCDGYNNTNIGCGAQLEVVEGDLYKTFTKDGSGNDIIWFTCRCIECNRENDIDESLINDGIKPYIPEKIRHPLWLYEYEMTHSVKDSYKP